MNGLLPKLVLVVGVLLIAVAVWSLAVPSRPPVADMRPAHAQLATLCQQLKPRGGSCGARAREPEAGAAAMSSAVSPAQAIGEGGAPPVTKPIDLWGNAVRVSIDNGGLRLQSPGQDGQFNSGDDLEERCAIE
jgi:hypothetical protein